MDDEMRTTELEGFARGTLCITSDILTGDYVGKILGTKVEYIQNKGDWALNPKTGRKIRQYDKSFWCKYFEDRNGDSFDKSVDDAISFLKEHSEKVYHLKELDDALEIAIELVIKKGDFYIGNVFSREQLCYLADNDIEFGLSIYQMISGTDYA